MNISWKRFVRELGPTIEHCSEHPKRDMQDLFAVLTGKSRYDIKLRVFDEIMGNHGVESLCDKRAGLVGWIADYSNTGDSYALTLLWDGEKLQLTSWCDFYERWERRLPRSQQRDY